MSNIKLQIEEQLQGIFTIAKLLNYNYSKLKYISNKDFYIFENKTKSFALSLDDNIINLFSYDNSKEQFALSEDLKNYKIIFDKLTSLFQ